MPSPYSALSRLLALLLLLPRLLSAQPVYQFTPIPSFDGTGDQAHGINASGQVVGLSNASSGTLHAFLFSKGVMTDLGVGNGTASVANAINASGVIVGGCSNGSSLQACLWTSKRVFQPLGTLGGSGSECSAINASGQIVGFSYIAGDANIHAFLYANGKMTDLGTLGGDTAQAQSINDSGQITGYSSNATNTADHAFLYVKGKMTDLGTLGGLASEADAINASGEIAGTSDPVGTSTSPHAFLWAAKGGMKDLGSLGYDRSDAYGINDSGQVVGATFDASDNPAVAFLYTGGVMYDLNKLTVVGNTGWILQRAVSINNAGQICGYGADPNNHYGAFLLTPVIPPTITIQPRALALLPYGASGNLTVVATGKPAPTYLWHLNNAVVTGGNVSGINNSTLTFHYATSANAGFYSVTVSNAAGSITSAIAKLTVTPVAPKITTQPKSASVPLEGTAHFSVAAFGSPTLQYQWTFNGKSVTGANIFGATTANLTIKPVGSANAGSYQVTVTNSTGSAKSSPVKLTVK